ncbi:MAG: PIN domain-containing protein [Nanoarchaeota archaeon]
MLYIVDTYAWVEYLIGSKKGSILKKLREDDSNGFLTVECCLAELKSWCHRDGQDFERVYDIVRSNSIIIRVAEADWILAADEKIRRRDRHPDFGLIDAVILVKQKERGCKVVSGDRHFKGLKDVVFLG